MRTRRLTHALLFLLVVTASPITASAQDWPRWRGADFSGTAPETDVFPARFGLKVLWRKSLGAGYSGVVVANGHAVTMASDGDDDVLVALDARTGHELWRLPLGPTFPPLEGSNGGPVSTPAIDSDLVVALGPRGDLVAVDLRTGSLHWSVDLVDDLDGGTPHWGFGTSPIIDGQRVFVLTGGPSAALTAFDRDNGDVVWSTGSDNVVYQSPILWKRPSGTQLVAAGSAEIFAVEPEDGRQLWRSAHDGSGFYRRILNPVVVTPQSLFLTHARGGSKRVRLEDTDGDLALVDEWESRDLKLNYATPILHRGHLYGYNRNFLTSIDASDGTLNWKSREPGNGFPIVVDDHLVVLTKDGTLHVARASPDGYEERASLEVFDHIAWTPPSFAHGRIYARDSESDVVAVGVTGTPTTTTDESDAGLLHGTEFAAWVATLEGATDKSTRIRAYLDRQKAFPIVEDERFVHVVVESTSRDVAVQGGFLGAKRQRTLRRVPETDLHYASFELEPDARIQYQFVHDFETVEPDAKNPRRSESLVYPGEVSTLVMPAAPVPAPREEGPLRGRIEVVPFSTETLEDGRITWGGDRPVSVYLPPAYEVDERRRFPTLYVLYGRRMLDSARLDRLVDGLIGSELDPLIAIFVPSTNSYEYARSLKDEHAAMLRDELVPLIDTRYRTMATPDARAVIGVSEAAFHALELGIDSPDVFGKVGAQSPLAIGEDGDAFLRRLAGSSPSDVDFYLDWGRYDHSNDATETDIPGWSRRVRALLQERGHRVLGREWADSSDIPIWLWRSREMLPALFPRADGAQR